MNGARAARLRKRSLRVHTESKGGNGVADERGNDYRSMRGSNDWGTHTLHMRHPETLGAAVWADPEDIARRHAYVDGEKFWLGRDPYNYDQIIGVDDDRHVFLCSGTRGGKGRSIILPNLLSWKGSVVSVDPKGENASIAAARRAYGDEYCEGMECLE